MADDDADEMASWSTCTEDGPFTSTAAAAAEATTTSSPTSAARHNATKITAEIAVEIFKAGGPGAKRSGVSKVLAERYGITMKAVRDIWNLRTWTRVTMPLWSSEGPTMTTPGDEMHEGMADATAAASASCTSSALGHHALCYEAERVAGRSSVTGLGQQTFDKKTQSLSVLSVGSASSPTERTESDCFEKFDFNIDFEAVSGLIRSVPDNPCADWSTGSVMEPVAYAAHALDCVAPAATVASRSQGAASARLETATEAGQADLARGDADGAFIDGWAIPRIQWLTPPYCVDHSHHAVAGLWPTQG